MSNKRAYRLNDDAIHAIKELQQRLRVTSRGIPGPDDPLSFDPESDAMQPAETKIREMMGEIADAAGLPPDLAYAIRRTGLVVTDRNKDLLDSAQTAAWNDPRRISNVNEDRLMRSQAHRDFWST